MPIKLILTAVDADGLTGSACLDDIAKIVTISPNITMTPEYDAQDAAMKKRCLDGFANDFEDFIQIGEQN